MNTYSKQLADRYLGYLLIGFFLPVTRLLGITMRRDHTLKEPPRVILFIKILGLGSLVLSAESIRAIKRKYPEARLILLSDSTIASGIKPFNLFDEYWTVNSGSVGSVVVDSVRYLVMSWRVKNSWVVDLEVYSKLTTVFALLTLARNRFGFYLSPVFFRKYLNTHNIHFDQSGFLEDNYGEMAACVVNETIQTQLSLNNKRTAESKKKYIALNNTCSDLALVRKLPDSTVVEICVWLLNHTTYNIAFLGSPKDKQSIESFLGNYPDLQRYQERISNKAGTYEFDAYYNFLEQDCAFLITIDSGPLHIAKVLGLPTISIWGPTNPSNYLRIDPKEQDRHLFYYHQAPCSPCVHLKTSLPCGGDNFCMKEIKPKDIIEKIERLLLSIQEV